MVVLENETDLNLGVDFGDFLDNNEALMRLVDDIEECSDIYIDEDEEDF